MLGEALADNAAWREEGVEIPVAVNVSARQIDDPGLVAAVADALEVAGASASWLSIEITESALNEPSIGALDALRGLRDLGVSLAMDDFGTGSSSLAALRQLPVDQVKLDRRFQEGIETDGAARAVVAAVMQLSHALGLTAVAEGVEREDQLDRAGRPRLRHRPGLLPGHPDGGGADPGVRALAGADDRSVASRYFVVDGGLTFPSPATAPPHAAVPSPAPATSTRARRRRVRRRFSTSRTLQGACAGSPGRAPGLVRLPPQSRDRPARPFHTPTTR